MSRMTATPSRWPGVAGAAGSARVVRRNFPGAASVSQHCQSRYNSTDDSCTDTTGSG
jgi:hypothetical protein